MSALRTPLGWGPTSMPSEWKAQRLKRSLSKSLKLGDEALTETVLPHRLQGIGFRGRHVDEDRPDRRRDHLALTTNESILRELLIPWTAWMSQLHGHMKWPVGTSLNSCWCWFLPACSARATVTAGSQQKLWRLVLVVWSKDVGHSSLGERSKQNSFSGSFLPSKHRSPSVTQAQRLPACILKCGEGSSLRSRRSGTDPCWRWCCEGHTAGPQPLGSLWAPAERWAPVPAFARRACRLSRGRWKAGGSVHFHQGERGASSF